MGSRNLGGDKQFLCCECCKKGRKMAETGGVCEKNVKADDLCQHAFLTCCKDTQAAIPTSKSIFIRLIILCVRSRPS